jgi:cytochrome c551
MYRPSVPFALAGSVAAATFGLAQWHPFSPTVAAAPSATGDATRGKAIFGSTCSGCHGADASGGVGPRLVGSGLNAAAVQAVVASGRGVMPAGLVAGQDAADVAAFVASIAK